MEKLQLPPRPLPEKSQPSLSQQSPSKNWDPVKFPPFLKIWSEAQPPPHYENLIKSSE